MKSKGRRAKFLLSAKCRTRSQDQGIVSASPKTLYKAIRAGRLPAYRVAGIRLDPTAVAQWLRERPTR